MLCHACGPASQTSYQGWRPCCSAGHSSNLVSAQALHPLQRVQLQACKAQQGRLSHGLACNLQHEDLLLGCHEEQHDARQAWLAWVTPLVLDSTDTSTRAGEYADVAHTLISWAEKFWGSRVVGDLPTGSVMCSARCFCASSRLCPQGFCGWIALYHKQAAATSSRCRCTAPRFIYAAFHSQLQVAGLKTASSKPAAELQQCLLTRQVECRVT